MPRDDQLPKSWRPHEDNRHTIPMQGLLVVRSSSRTSSIATLARTHFVKGDLHSSASILAPCFGTNSDQGFQNSMVPKRRKSGSTCCIKSTNRARYEVCWLVGYSDTPLYSRPIQGSSLLLKGHSAILANDPNHISSESSRVFEPELCEIV